MWLFDTEQTEGVVIKHARNGRENRLPELPHFSVDGYLQRRIKFMSFSGVIGTAAPVSRFLTSSPQMETP